jgi:hypothetical protein
MDVSHMSFWQRRHLVSGCSAPHRPQGPCRSADLICPYCTPAPDALHASLHPCAAGCCSVYVQAATQLMEEGAASEGEVAVLRAALQSALDTPSRDEGAWIMRKAFDTILSGAVAAKERAAQLVASAAATGGEFEVLDFTRGLPGAPRWRVMDDVVCRSGCLYVQLKAWRPLPNRLCRGLTALRSSASGRSQALNGPRAEPCTRQARQALTACGVRLDMRAPPQIMGGRSQSDALQYDAADQAAVYSGRVTTDGGGGFASLRSDDCEPGRTSI